MFSKTEEYLRERYICNYSKILQYTHLSSHHMGFCNYILCITVGEERQTNFLRLLNDFEMWFLIQGPPTKPHDFPMYGSFGEQVLHEEG